MVKCVHHWQIDQAGHGVCQKCGAEKDFPLNATPRRIQPDEIAARKREQEAERTIAAVIGKKRG